MTESVEDKILVFLKAPQKGNVKTRLGQSIGDEAALKLYEAFVFDTLKTACMISKPLIFAYPENSIPEINNWLKKRFEILPQKGVDLGVRMANAFDYAFKNGAKRVLLTGTDIPELNSEILKEGLNKLRDYDCVFGPSKDGGYYLAGFSYNAFDPCFFDGIPWSTDSVLKETLLKTEEKKLSCFLLETLNDIDTLRDLREFIEEGKNLKSETRSVIDQLLAKRVIP